MINIHTLKLRQPLGAVGFAVFPNSQPRRFLRAISGLILAPLFFCGGALAFAPGNLVVCRVGDGSVLGAGTAPVFLDEYTTAGSFVSSVALPTTASGNNFRLTIPGNTAIDCQITRSADGRFILASGYDAPTAVLNVAAMDGTTTRRVIGRVDMNGIVDTSTGLTDAVSQGGVRGAASTNGTDLWISGNGTGLGISPIWYTTLGSTTSTPITATPLNLRAVNIFGGQLYVSGGSGSGSFRLSAVGTGTPVTSGQPLIALPGVPNSISLNSFFFADLDAGVAGVDTLYVADDAAAVIRKFSLNGAAWSAKGTIALSGVVGLAGVSSGSTVTLYVTNATSLRTLTDSSGPNATINGTLTTLTSSPAQTVFRGVTFTPVSPSTISVNWGPRSFSRHVTVTATNSGPGVKRIYFKLPQMSDFQFVDGNSARLKVLKNGGTWSFQAFVEDNAGDRSDAVTYSTQ